jgi:hypothetical protein
MSGEYPHKTRILQMKNLQLSNQLIQYHQEAKKHHFGLELQQVLH